MSTIGPKDLEDFTDSEIRAIDESEGGYRVLAVPGGGLSAFRDGPAVRDLPKVPHHHHDPGTWPQAICFMNDCLARDCYESHQPDPLD
jgi:hypothetical protein